MNLKLTLSVRSLLLASVAAALCLTSLPASGSAGTAGTPVERDQLDRFMYRYERADIDPTVALDEVAASGVMRFRAGKETFEVALEPHDLRAPSYVAQETREDGTTRVLPAPDVTTYAGHVVGKDGSQARFTLDGNRVEGLIVADGERLYVEPMLDYTLSAKSTDYVLYRESDLRPEADPGTCGVTEAHKIGRAIESFADEAAAAAQAAPASYLVQLATETDNEYVTALGSAQAANSEILGIVNQIDGVYQAEVGIGFQVVLQNTYSGSDPYSNSTDPSTILSEFRTRWNSAMTGVTRDLAHMWTGKDMTGTTVGIAWVGVVCNSPAYSYGVSQRFTLTPQKYVLSSHEIGHNFSACHSDTSCNPNPSSCSNTIMQSFVGSTLSFCTFSRNQITTHANANSACLGGTPPQSVPAAPSNLTATAASRSRIDLAWVDNSSNETGFKIERSGNGTTFTEIATVGANVTTYASTGLRRDKVYYYRIRAYNSVGDSVYSNIASARTRRKRQP